MNALQWVWKFFFAPLAPLFRDTEPGEVEGLLQVDEEEAEYLDRQW